MALSWSSGATAGPRCPDCGEPSRPVLYGLPAAEAEQAASDGRIVLAGCITPSDPELWLCPSGHRWRDDDDERWQAHLLAVLTDYGYRED